jgi:hypothetical protein
MFAHDGTKVIRSPSNGERGKYSVNESSDSLQPACRTPLYQLIYKRGVA